MAWTEKYVAADSPGSLDGTSPTEDGGGVGPWTLLEAISTAAALDRVNVESGTYATFTGSNKTITNGTDAHTAIWFRGYETSPGDKDLLAFNADGSLDTSGFPVINTGTFTLIPGSYNTLSALNITGASTARVVGATNNDNLNLIGCKIVNTVDNGSANAVTLDDRCNIESCDLETTGANSSYVLLCDASNVITNCRILNKSATAGTGCVSAQESTQMIGTVLAGDGIGYNFDFATTAAPIIHGCSFHGLDTAFQRLSAAQGTAGIRIANCIVYNCTKWIDNLYGTDNIAVHEFSNAIDSTGATRTGVDDSVIINEVTLAVDPFTDESTWDFTPNDAATGGALCKAAGLRSFRDVGAFQHEDAGGGSALPRALLG